MITFSKLGKKGNLGNQLFQIASTIGIAAKNNQNYAFPFWEYSMHFRSTLPVIKEIHNFEKIQEKVYEYQETYLGKGNYDLNGWFQSERYFDVKKTREQFAFRKSLIHKVKDRYSHLFDSPHILISVRRGDFVNHPYYFQLSYKYYFLAIVNSFPDWKSRKIIFTSDEIAYCKNHFSFLKNAYFLEDLNAIQQLVFGSLCKDFIISNSTFSWWLAWLGEKENSQIIRPINNFRGEFAEKNNDKDYFPQRWTIFDSSGKFISLTYTHLIIIGEFNRLKCWGISFGKTIKRKLKNILKKWHNF